MMEYVDSVGRVPRGMTETSSIGTIKLLLLTKLVLDAGGELVVEGFGTPEAVADLMQYELGIRGLGEGRMKLFVRAKGAD